MSESNGRVSTRDFIQAQIDGLREHQDTKFAALEAVVKQQSKDTKETADDHETRIRTLEKRAPWRTAIEGVAVLGGIIGTALGLKQ